MSTVRVIAGHYGSGKSEFSVNLALHLAASGRRVALADLDIVNPYFRSRERAQLLQKHGVWVISSSLGHSAAIDLPAISGEVRGPLRDPAWDAVLDMGGDSAGARALVGFVQDIQVREHEFLLVVNAYRPQTQGSDGVLRHLHAIEATVGLKLTGLISNTHALRDTTTQDVLNGYELAKQVSGRSGLPIRYISAIPEALAGLPDGLEGERLPIRMMLRDEWM